MDANRTEIKSKIGELERQLDIIDTRQTEVYARIVGYYRSVKNWNKGKKEEYQMRTPFIADKDKTTQYGTINYKQAPAMTVKTEINEQEQPELMLQSKKPDTAENHFSYLFFQRKTCPNCPPMKTAIANANVQGEVIDVDTEAGLNTAKEYNIFSAPTVVFLDNEKREIFRTDSPELFTTFVEKKENATV